MQKLTFEQFVILACLADYNFTPYEILGFAKDLGYAIPIANLLPTIEELNQYGLIQRYVSYGETVVTNMPLSLQTFELTHNGTNILLEEMGAVDLLIKRIRKQVRQLQ